MSCESLVDLLPALLGIGAAAGGAAWTLHRKRSKGYAEGVRDTVDANRRERDRVARELAKADAQIEERAEREIAEIKKREEAAAAELDRILREPPTEDRHEAAARAARDAVERARANTRATDRHPPLTPSGED